MEKQVRQ